MFKAQNEPGIKLGLQGQKRATRILMAVLVGDFYGFKDLADYS
jgi:hypothetical protein